MQKHKQIKPYDRMRLKSLCIYRVMCTAHERDADGGGVSVGNGGSGAGGGGSGGCNDVNTVWLRHQ